MLSTYGLTQISASYSTTGLNTADQGVAVRGDLHRAINACHREVQVDHQIHRRSRSRLWSMPLLCVFRGQRSPRLAEMASPGRIGVATRPQLPSALDRAVDRRERFSPDRDDAGVGRSGARISG